MSVKKLAKKVLDFHKAHPEILKGIISQISKGGKSKKSQKGMLRSCGYSVNSKGVERRSSLRKAVKKFGYGKVVRKLTLISNLTKNTRPVSSKKMKRDAKYLKKIRK